MNASTLIRNPLIDKANNWRRSIISRLQSAIHSAVLAGHAGKILAEYQPVESDAPALKALIAAVDNLREELALEAASPRSLGFSLHDLGWYRDPIMGYLKNVSHMVKENTLRAHRNDGRMSKEDARKQRDLKVTQSVYSTMIALLDLEINIRLEPKTAIFTPETVTESVAVEA
jgi:hypothetical protein